jgi:hypothetical protein
MRKLLDLAGTDSLATTTLCGHRILPDTGGEFLGYTIARISTLAVFRCQDNNVNEEHLRHAIREVVAVWRRTRRARFQEIDEVSDAVAEIPAVELAWYPPWWGGTCGIETVYKALIKTPGLSIDEARVRLLAIVFVCADRALVHGGRENGFSKAEEFHLIAFVHFFAADAMDRALGESARDVVRRFSQLGSHARHAPNYELLEQAERYWEANIDPGLSNEKAAELLTKVVPLSHVTLRRHVAEFKRKKLHHLKKE